MLMEKAPTTVQAISKPEAPSAVGKGNTKNSAVESSDANFDPWSANTASKGKGKSKAKNQHDPWEAKQDPWSTPSAKRIQERQQAQQPAKARNADAIEKSDVSDIAVWNEWVDSGKP